ncbi:MAG: transaldolase [Actinomycetota bacterium]|nr:transaldolase [Actinomycetota bacterium]
MPNSNLHGLHHAGVSVWSDSISRSMLDTGELTRRIEEDAITGVTSNPTIFASAIVGSDDYTPQLQDLKSAGSSTEQIVKSLMADDITRACDVLADVYKSTDGRDGFVSVEVSPTLASDTDATVAEARDWAKRIDRPNLLIKVPATAKGIPAIRRLIGEGISVNVTLIFSLERYAEVIDAYLDGLDHFHEIGGDMSTVASVASFFVSRFDTEVDKRLEQLGTPEAEALQGTTAVANARVAYGVFTNEFGSIRYGLLAGKGARPQKPLWASTSTKNPAYDDLLYVDGLVASNTINTMPLDTIAAYQDHGLSNPRSFDAIDVAHARTTLHHLEQAGVDYGDVTKTLEMEGVSKFIASWNELLAGVDNV